MNSSEDYIKNNFLTLEQLSELSKESVDYLQELIDNGCLPLHSYEMENSCIIQSYFGVHKEQAKDFYYSKAHLRWIENIKQLHVQYSYSEIKKYLKDGFAVKYKAMLLELKAYQFGMAEYFSSEMNLNDERVDGLIDEEWNLVMDGTYGLSTVHMTSEDIASMAIYIRKIDHLTNKCRKEELPSKDMIELKTTVQLLDKISTPFAPHERDKCSRQRCIDDIVNKYKLDLALSTAI